MTGRLEFKKMNKNLVYRSLSSSESASALDISMRTRLSIPTVTQNLKELVDEGLAENTGYLESTGGRRAVGYRKVADAKYAIGIDITKNHITIALVNLAEEIVCMINREEFRFEDTDACYDEVLEKAYSLVEANHIEKERILGVGVSLPSIVDRKKNEVVYSKIIDAPRQIVRKFSSRLPFRVEIFNDANSAGYAEYQSLGEDATRDDDKVLVYMMLSNSVGGAIVEHANIYLGANCKGGEIGHMKIVPNGKPCFCGQKGCANAYISASVLSDRTGGNLEAFFDAMEQGNEEFRRLFDEYLYYLAITVVNVRMIFDGDIILGGYVGSLMKQEYMDQLGSKIRKLDPYDDGSDFVRSCRYKNAASAVGAAMMFIVEFISQV